MYKSTSTPHRHDWEADVALAQPYLVVKTSPLFSVALAAVVRYHQSFQTLLIESHANRTMYRSISLLLLCVLLPLLTQSEPSESVGAYIPASHTQLYNEFNAIIFGDVSLARAAVKGPLAVMGKANLADFDIAGNGDCDKDTRSLVVGGALTARMGAVNSGYTVVGRRSRIDHSVRMTCTSRVEQYDPHRNGDLEFDTMRVNVLRETGDMCVTNPTGEVENVNGTLRFSPGEPGFSCYTYFKVKTDDLRLVNKWEYASDDTFRNIVVVVSGLRVDFRDFVMEGFNAKRTLIVFCAVYGSFGFYNAKLHGSVLAPTASFTTSNTVINGSIIAGNLRGSLATLRTAYITC